MSGNETIEEARKKIPGKQPTSRTHFSAALYSTFPAHLLNNIYEEDERLDHLRPQKSHEIGRPAPIADLRYWDGNGEDSNFGTAIDIALDTFQQSNTEVTDLDISGHRGIDAQSIASLVLRSGNSLSSLKLNKCHGYQGFDSSEIIDNLVCLTNLKRLHVSDNPLLIDDEAVERLATLPALESLDISGCSFLTDRALVAVANTIGARLVEIFAARNDNFTLIGAKELILRCEKIKILDFSNCARLSFVGLIIATGDGQKLFGSRSIETANLNGCKLLSEESLDWMCAANAPLASLSVSGAVNLSEASLMGLVYSNPQLTHLDVSGCPNISGTAVRVIAEKCRSITSLNLSEICGSQFLSSDASSLLESCGALTTLNLSGNNQLGDLIFSQMPLRRAIADREVQFLDNLKSLSIARCGLTALGVANMALRCPHLTHLDLSGLPAVTDGAISHVVANCKKLVRLYLDDCDSLTDRAVVEACYGLPDLTVLHLSSSKDLYYESTGDRVYHKQFTDDSLEAVLDGARRLRELTMRNQNALTLTAKWFSRGFRRRAGHFSLQRIDFSGVDSLSSSGAVAVFSHCWDLCEVKISRRLPAQWRGKKFWDAAFPRAACALSYDETKQLINAEDSKRRLVLEELIHGVESGRMFSEEVRRAADGLYSINMHPIVAGRNSGVGEVVNPSLISTKHAAGASRIGEIGSPDKHQHQHDQQRPHTVYAALSPSHSPSPSKQQRQLNTGLVASTDDFGIAMRSPSPSKQDLGLAAPTAATATAAAGATPSPSKRMRSQTLTASPTKVSKDFEFNAEGQFSPSPSKQRAHELVSPSKRVNEMVDMRKQQKRNMRMMQPQSQPPDQPIDVDMSAFQQIARTESHDTRSEPSTAPGMSAAGGTATGTDTNTATATVTAGTRSQANHPRHGMTIEEQIKLVEELKVRNMNVPYTILRPHPLADVWRYREKYIRARLMERHALRLIQSAWRVHSLWKHIRDRAYARKIAYWYKNILLERERMKKLKEFIIRRSACAIQRVYRRFFRRRKKAAIEIQRIIRGFLGKKFPEKFRRQTAAATKIQTWARGWMARLSDRVTLALFYLRLPPFWKKMLHTVPYEPGNPLSCAVESVRSMLIDQGSVPTGIVPSAFHKDNYLMASWEGAKLNRAKGGEMDLSGDDEIGNKNQNHSHAKDAKEHEEKVREELELEGDDDDEQKPQEQQAVPIPGGNDDGRDKENADPAAKVSNQSDGADKGKAGAAQSQNQSQSQKTPLAVLRERNTSLDELRGVLEDVHDLNVHLRDNVLAPPTPHYVQPLEHPPRRLTLPHPIPQSFDRMPYSTTEDGRHVKITAAREGLLATDAEGAQVKLTYRQIAFCKAAMKRIGHGDTAGGSTNALSVGVGRSRSRVLADSATDEAMSSLGIPSKAPGRHAVHTFTMTFWPLPGRLNNREGDVEDNSTIIFDPEVNNFELVKAEGEKATLLCEQCDRHLRLLMCQTCKRGFCFICGFQTHGRSSRQNHVLEFMEPRILATTVVRKTVLYHIGVAKQSVRELRQLVTQLKTISEVKRIERERELAREAEEEEERAKKELIRIAKENYAKHVAASRIEALFRRFKARCFVAEKRISVYAEKAERALGELTTMSVRIQRLYRGFKTRQWLSNLGVECDTRLSNLGNLEKNGLMMDEIVRKLKRPGYLDMVKEEDLSRKVTKEVQWRREVARKCLIASVLERENRLTKLLDANIAYWERVAADLQPQEDRMLEVKRRTTRDHEQASAELERVRLEGKLSPEELKAMELNLRVVVVPSVAAEERAVNLKQIRTWATHLLRTLYRRRLATRLQVADTEARLQWVLLESESVKRIQHHLQRRLEFLQAQKKDANLIVEWLSRHLTLCDSIQASLDSQQEAIMLEEIARLSADEATTMKFDGLMQELHQALIADNHLIAERVALEKKAIPFEAQQTSDEAVEVNEQLFLVKRKRMILSGGNDAVVDKTKLALQDKITEEETRSTSTYAFPGDDPSFTIADMSKIRCVLVEPFVPRSHCSVDDVTDVYYSQPWLAEEAVKDVRLEDELMASQLDSERLSGDLAALRKSIKLGMDSLKEIRGRVEKLEKEIPKWKQPPRDEKTGELIDEPPEAVNQRMAVLEALQRELKMQKTELSFAQQMQERTKGMEAPLTARMEANLLKQNGLKVQIVKARERRDRIAVAFFEYEATFCGDNASKLRKQLEDAKELRSRLESQLEVCRAATSTAEALETLADQMDRGDPEFTAEKCETLGLPLPREFAQNWYRRMRSDHLQQPRHVVSALDALSCAIGTRARCLEIEIAAAKQLESSLSKECAEVEGYSDRRGDYESRKNLLLEYLKGLRKSKSIQSEYNERLKFLYVSRNTQLRRHMDTHRQELEEAAKKKMEHDRLEAERKATKTFTRKMAEKLRKNIRSTKDKIRNFRRGIDVTFDEEESRMAKYIKQKAQASLAGRPEGIARLYITATVDEETQFQKLNLFLRDKGLPYFRKLTLLGGHIWLWAQWSFNGVDFITEIQLNHSKAGHPLNRTDELKEMNRNMPDDFEVVKHKGGLVPMELWVARDETKTRGLNNMAVSHNEQEDLRMAADGFERVSPQEVDEEAHLLNYGIPAPPGALLWWTKANKGVGMKVGKHTTDTNALLLESMRIKNLLKERPGDQGLLKLQKSVKQRLDEAYEREKEFKKQQRGDKEGEEPTSDPLIDAMELMALSEEELERWTDVFRRLDKEGQAVLNLEKFFEEELRLPLTKFAMSVFTDLDAVDEDGNVEFGDFLKAVGTYCLMGREEILMSLFQFADTEKIGYVTGQQLFDLMNVLNPFDKSRMKSALMSLAIPWEAKLYFPDFERINRQVPAALFPALRLQKDLREHTMGYEWWVKKQLKYMNVRKKVAGSIQLTSELAEMEAQRFYEDEARLDRMAKRKREIQDEPSTIRRGLLKAIQLADEFS